MSINSVPTERGLFSSLMKSTKTCFKWTVGRNMKGSKKRHEIVPDMNLSASQWVQYILAVYWNYAGYYLIINSESQQGQICLNWLLILLNLSILNDLMLKAWLINQRTEKESNFLNRLSWIKWALWHIYTLIDNLKMI